MHSTEKLKLLVTNRLTAAAADLVAIFQKAIDEHKDELKRQRRFFDVHRRVFQTQCVHQEEVTVDDGPSSNKDSNSIVDQEYPEPLQIKEELSSTQLEFKQDNGDHSFSTNKDIRESEDQSVDWNPGEPMEECDVKIPIITSVVSGANSELQQPSLPPTVSQNQAQNKSELKSGQNHSVCNNSSWEFSSPGTSAQSIGIQTGFLNQLACKEDVIGDSNQDTDSVVDQGVHQPLQITEQLEEPRANELGLIQGPENLQMFSAKEKTNDIEDQTVESRPEEPMEESHGKSPIITSVVSETNSELQQPSIPAAVSKSLAQKEGENDSGKNQFHWHLNECLLSSPGTSSESTAVQTVQKPHVGLESGKHLHMDSRPYVCQTCDKTYKSKSDLTKHCKSHTGEKPFICQICAKGFSMNSKLTQHMTVHTGVKKHVCEVCLKGFLRVNQLKQHMKVHTGERPYLCQICGQSFTQKRGLETHIRLHMDERPHVCQECGKTFSEKNSLNRHMGTHRDTKPFVCKVCGKGFIRLYNLNVHERVHKR